VSGTTAAGALNPITASATRNTYPGWSVSGQGANLTLDIPTAAQPGQYASTLTLTAVTVPP